MKQDLKKELHSIIDAIEDEEILSILKEDLASYTLEMNTSKLTPEQLEELDGAIKEADDENELQDWSGFKRELENKWKEQ